jgi:hypothetical protein
MVEPSFLWRKSTSSAFAILSETMYPLIVPYHMVSEGERVEGTDPGLAGHNDISIGPRGEPGTDELIPIGWVEYQGTS